jgi:ankyrin repeat protein
MSISSLIHAAEKGDLALCKKTLKDKPDVNDHDEFGKLQVACLLLQHKADPNKPERDGKTALHQARSSRQTRT